MSEYEKHVLQGVIAGLITGVVAAVLMLLVLSESLESLAEELVRQQLATLPPEEVERAVKSVKEVTRVALRIAPVAQVFQHLLIGALFGLVKGALRNKLRLGEAASALVAGVLYTLCLGVVPVVALLTIMAELENAISRYFSLYVATLLSGTVFTASIILVSVVRGPWSRFVDAKPKTV